MALPRRVSDVFGYELLADVAETGSISRAARRHRLSQAAVSARMRALERSLRVRLLHRGPGGTTLTADGAAVLDRARPLLAAAGDLEAHLRSLADAPPVLRIAASSTVAEHLLPGRLAAMRRDHPDVRIELRSVNSAAVLAALRAGRVDVGFVEDGHPPPDTAHRVVGRDELVVLVAPDHPWAARGTVTAAELAATPLITRESGSGARSVVEDRLRADRPATGEPATELTSNTAIKNAAVQGLGVAILSSLVVAPEITSGRLRRIAVDGLDLGRDLHAVWDPAVAPPAAAHALFRGTARRIDP